MDFEEVGFEHPEAKDEQMMNNSDHNSDTVKEEENCYSE